MTAYGYAAPSRISDLDDQEVRIRQAGASEIFREAPGPDADGTARPRRDDLFIELLSKRERPQRGADKRDRLIVTSLDVFADNRREATVLFQTLHEMGVALESLEDGLSAGLGGTEYAVHWIKALERAEKVWRRGSSEPRKSRENPGRKPALTATEIEDLVSLRNASGRRMTWEEIVNHFNSRGRAVGNSTVRRLYNQAMRERKDGSGAG